MLDTYLARYGNQDIHRLRGVERLSRRDKHIFAACLSEHMEIEFGTPNKDGPPTDGD